MNLEEETEDMRMNLGQLIHHVEMELITGAATVPINHIRTDPTSGTTPHHIAALPVQEETVDMPPALITIPLQIIVDIIIRHLILDMEEVRDRIGMTPRAMRRLDLRRWKSISPSFRAGIVADDYIVLSVKVWMS